VIAAGVLWYLLSQQSSKLGQETSAPALAPKVSPQPQASPPKAAASQTAPEQQSSPSAVPSPATIPSSTPVPVPSAVSVREPEMIAIRGGSYAMGSNEDPTERPVHQATIKPFAVGKYPVTVQEWNECAAAKACGFTATGRDDAPVTNVSWTDTQEYIDFQVSPSGSMRPVRERRRDIGGVTSCNPAWSLARIAATLQPSSRPR
jgi:formylglycine-generating enzyme required for sulfatase activity